MFRTMSVEEELEDGGAGFEVEVEGAVNEFEGSCAAVEEALHRGEKFFQRELSDVVVERGETEIAVEWAAARRFDVDNAVCDVVVGVTIVG
jgi:hypothetical protein